MSKALEFSLEFDETILDQDEREVTKPVIVHFCYDDVGIGSYEFWGASGNDVNWQVEILDVVGLEEEELEQIDEEKWLRAGWDYVSGMEDDYYNV